MNNRKPKYGYRYDGLNRLTASYYQLPGTAVPRDDSFNTAYSYDANGNILFLERFGGEDDPTLPPTEMDDLEYTYDLGNRLKKVKDHSNAPAGFDPGTAGTNAQYTYDDFGNLETDPYKGIANIVYNHLHPEASAGQALPTEITYQGGEKIEYRYTADGTKLKKTATDNQGTATNTEYKNGFQYENGILQFFPHTSTALSAGAEGYVKATEIVSGYIYSHVFTHKDHLGNIRIKYTTHPWSGELRILEENNYYPYGLTHKNYNTTHSTLAKGIAVPLDIIPVTPDITDTYKYKFGGKEYQDEFNINTYDFGARNYDPALGRWMNLDPLAEMMRRHSPYNYAFDNPVYFIDPDGMAPIAGALKSGLFVQNTNFLGVSDITNGMVGTMGRGERLGGDTDYKLNSDGSTERVDENDGSEKDATDTLYATDNEGNVDKSRSIELDKSVMDSKKTSAVATNKGPMDVDEYDITNDENAKDVFEFVASNSSKAEWSVTGIGNQNGDNGQNKLTTSGEIRFEAGAPLLLASGYSIRYSNHSHHFSNNASGGDKRFATRLNSKFSSAATRIFHKGNYIRYNSNGSIKTVSSIKSIAPNF